MGRVAAVDKKNLTLGERIRQAREKAGISKQKLAQLAGIAHTTIARIERNQTSPKADSLERICNALNISVAHLWVSYDGDFEEARCLFNQLSSTNQNIILVQMRALVEMEKKLKSGNMR